MSAETAESSAFFGWRATAVLVVLGAGAALFLRWQDLHARNVVEADPLTRPTPALWPEALDRSAAAITEVRAMKLVTMEVRTRVTSTSSDTSLMGDVTATVTAPVRLLYGTDLSGFGGDAAAAAGSDGGPDGGPAGGPDGGQIGGRPGAIAFSPIHEMYVVTVPAPTRLAAEVLGQFEDAEVKTGWMRKRATDGEYHLGLARRDLSLKAQQAAPDDEQAGRIREGTREQVAELVRRVVGDRSRVVVRFADEVER